MDFKNLWAKSDPYHPLWCHLLDAAAVCEALLPRFGGVEGLSPAWTMYLVALHDIGKVDAKFVGKAPQLDLSGLIPATSGECLGFRHEARSAEWIQAYLRQAYGWGRAAITAAQAIRGHHGDFHADVYNESEESMWHEFYAPLRDALAGMLVEILSVEPFALELCADASAFGMKLAGLIVLSDWIASNPDIFDYPQLPRDGLAEAYWQAARQEARRAVRRLQLDAPKQVAHDEPLSFAEVWLGLAPRPTQEALQDLCRKRRVPPGLAIIEAPMGEGKTEGAIYLAACWHRNGAYIALPTQATSNQMYDRYAKFLPDALAPRLVHGMAWLRDDVAPEHVAMLESDGADEPLLSREWFANAKRALLAPEGVGTVDQVLMAALNVKHGFLRFLGLTSKVLIIDEVHAYDAYMTTLMETLLEWCRALKVPVILLSATLSREQKRRLVEAYGGEGALPAAPEDGDEPYPLLTFAPLDGEPFVQAVPPDASTERIILLHRHAGALGRPEECARLASSLVTDGGCLCILADTVASAQKIFQALRAAPPLDTELFLFHARFRAEKRNEIEDEIVRRFGKSARDARPRRAIVVATQVVEQSLDVDFDAMLSEVAPLDLLLQRCGRLHRHAPVTRPPDQCAALHLLLPPGGQFSLEDFGSIAIKKSKSGEWIGVYDWETLLRTVALLEGRDAFHLPDDFRPLIEACYGATPISGASIPDNLFRDAAAMRNERREQSRRNAEKHLIAGPNPRGFDYARQPEAPVNEAEEGERKSYFRAQTREGDDSRTVLVLRDPAVIAAVRAGARVADWRPGKEYLRRLFLQKVNLPGWWLAGVTPEPGFEPLEAPNLLRRQLILPMPDGIWRGNKDGNAVTLHDDETLGLHRVERENGESRVRES